ncbi:unnamed protein product, partial [Prorocentrum cordatum]
MAGIFACSFFCTMLVWIAVSRDAEAEKIAQAASHSLSSAGNAGPGAAGAVRQEAAARAGDGIPPARGAARPRPSADKTVLDGWVHKSSAPDGSTGYRPLCVWVSDKYQFIGLKYAKVGGSTIIKMLKSAFCGVTFTGPFGSEVPCPDSKVLDHGQESARMERGRMLYPNCQQKLPDKRKWEEYFVFAFVRNPYSRRLSMVKYCMKGRMCEACLSPSCGTCSLKHCQAMYSNLVASDDSSYVDFVGHTETMAADMDTVFHEINRRFLERTGKSIAWRNDSEVTSMLVNKATGHQLIESNTSFSAFVACPGCVAHIQRMYRHDVRLFGYLPREGPPPREVRHALPGEAGKVLGARRRFCPGLGAQFVALLGPACPRQPLERFGKKGDLVDPEVGPAESDTEALLSDTKKGGGDVFLQLRQRGASPRWRLQLLEPAEGGPEPGESPAATTRKEEVDCTTPGGSREQEPLHDGSPSCDLGEDGADLGETCAGGWGGVYSREPAAPPAVEPAENKQLLVEFDTSHGPLHDNDDRMGAPDGHPWPPAKRGFGSHTKAPPMTLRPPGVAAGAAGEVAEADIERVRRVYDHDLAGRPHCSVSTPREDAKQFRSGDKHSVPCECVVELYELLWRWGHRSGSSSFLANFGFAIPDTIVIVHGKPYAWYFISKKDGRLLRKSGQHLTVSAIEKKLCRDGPEGHVAGVWLPAASQFPE